MNISRYIEEFVKKNHRYKSYSKICRKMLQGGMPYSLNSQNGYEESEYLPLSPEDKRRWNVNHRVTLCTCCFLAAGRDKAYHKGIKWDGGRACRHRRNSILWRAEISAWCGFRVYRKTGEPGAERRLWRRGYHDVRQYKTRVQYDSWCGRWMDPCSGRFCKRQQGEADQSRIRSEDQPGQWEVMGCLYALHRFLLQTEQASAIVISLVW